jgi:hypothetical protein
MYTDDDVKRFAKKLLEDATDNLIDAACEGHGSINHEAARALAKYILEGAIADLEVEIGRFLDTVSFEMYVTSRIELNG